MSRPAVALQLKTVKMKKIPTMLSVPTEASGAYHV